MTARLWIYKNNANQQAGLSWGDWEDFFAEGEATTWGSTEMIGRQNRGPAFEMQPGDQVLCWQTNRRAAIGLAAVVELAEYADANGTIQRDFVLDPVERFPTPVPLLDMRASDPELAAVPVFQQGNVATLYRTTAQQATVLLRACGTTGATPKQLVKAQRANPESERAAVRHVEKTFRSDGWDIRSVEQDKVGYDLHATRGTDELHLEVKGTIGADPAFFLTANEYRRAEDDHRWRLCLVRHALDTKRRTLDTWTAEKLLQQASFSPASYRVVMEVEA